VGAVLRGYRTAQPAHECHRALSDDVALPVSTCLPLHVICVGLSREGQVCDVKILMCVWTLDRCPTEPLSRAIVVSGLCWYTMICQAKPF
jgi:hypothetical protein